MDKINLIVADDHQLFRDGLTSLLNKHEHLEVLTSVSDGEALFEALEKGRHPDLILLDLSMPKMNGFEVLIKLRSSYKNIKAIAISMHDDGNYVAKCASYGAYGYLLKNTDEDELLVAIKKVYEGSKYYNQELSIKMIDSLSEVTPKRKLTLKEKEILQLLSKGLTTKEIAAKRYISTRTVETHRFNMLKKLEVKNTAELINKAYSLDLL
ncbi:MAG: response regulator [Wenyingzhuangia sp.]|jgi:two-component system, NarL family, response regulator NreC|uniref:response regulator transcription factor n=1 Tax=Wenyingzhuangia sp. TaxID=1964193 RepID=UPI00321B4BF9